jgi:hypothetical protein
MSDALSAVNAVIADMNKRGTSDRPPKENKLPAVYLSAVKCKFKARFVWDKNKKLYNEFNQYYLACPDKRQDGSEYIKHVFHRVKDTRDCVIRPFVDELGDFRKKASWNFAFFCDITEIEYEEGPKSKLGKGGPCVLISSIKFKNAFTEAITNLASTDDGKALLDKSFTATEPGMLFTVTFHGGPGGYCNIQLDPFLKMNHVFTPEVADKFEDITEMYCEKYGPENDNNGLIILEYYKKMLSERASHADPDSDEESLRAAQEITEKVTAKAAPKKSSVLNAPKVDTGGFSEDDAAEAYALMQAEAQ